MELWLPEAGKWEKWGDAGERVQTPSYKMNKFWGSNVQHGDDSLWSCIIYLKVPKRVDLKCSHRKKEMVIT